MNFIKTKDKMIIFLGILKKYKKEAGFFFAGLVGGALLVISPYSILKKMIAISQTDISIIESLSYAILILVILILFFLIVVCIKKFRPFVQRNSSLISIFLVLLTIIVTFSSFYVDRRNKIIKTNNSLMMINQLNYKYAKDFTEDKKQEWTYWIYFNLDLYKENLDFILSNSSEECSNDYVGILHDMEIVNEMNHLININSAWGIVFSDVEDLIEYDILFKKHKSELSSRASQIKDSLRDLVKDCYNLDIENLEHKNVD